jgi:hypothetical protein
MTKPSATLPSVEPSRERGRMTTTSEIDRSHELGEREAMKHKLVRLAFRGLRWLAAQTTHRYLDAEVAVFVLPVVIHVVDQIETRLIRRVSRSLPPGPPQP